MSLSKQLISRIDYTITFHFHLSLFSAQCCVRALSSSTFCYVLSHTITTTTTTTTTTTANQTSNKTKAKKCWNGQKANEQKAMRKEWLVWGVIIYVHGSQRLYECGLRQKACCVSYPDDRKTRKRMNICHPRLYEWWDRGTVFCLYRNARAMATIRHSGYLRTAQLRRRA